MSQHRFISTRVAHDLQSPSLPSATGVHYYSMSEKSLLFASSLDDASAADFRPVVGCDESIIQSSTVDMSIFQLAFPFSSLYYLTQSSLLHLQEGLYHAHFHFASSQLREHLKSFVPPCTTTPLSCYVATFLQIMFFSSQYWQSSTCTCKRQIRTISLPTSFSSRHTTCLTFCGLLCFISHRVLFHD